MKTTFGTGEEARTTESNWFIKGDNIRMERRAKSADQGDTGRFGAMIFNADRKMTYIVMQERKMYMEHSEV